MHVCLPDGAHSSSKVDYSHHNAPSTYRPEAGIAAGLDTLQDHPEEAAAGHTGPAVAHRIGLGLDPGADIGLDPGADIDLEVVRHTGPVLEAGIGLGEHRIDPGVVAVRSLVEEGRHIAHLEDPRSRQVPDGWSSRPWHRSYDRWRREVV